jgi:hypothetical protein
MNKVEKAQVDKFFSSDRNIALSLLACILCLVFMVFLLKQRQNLLVAKEHIILAAAYVRNSKLQNPTERNLIGKDDVEVFYYDRAYFSHRNQYLDPWGNKVKIDHDKKIIYLEGGWPNFWRQFGYSFEVSVE